MPKHKWQQQNNNGGGERMKSNIRQQQNSLHIVIETLIIPYFFSIWAHCDDEHQKET